MFNKNGCFYISWIRDFAVLKMDGCSYPAKQETILFFCAETETKNPILHGWQHHVSFHIKFWKVLRLASGVCACHSGLLAGWGLQPALYGFLAISASWLCGAAEGKRDTGDCHFI